MTSAETIVKTLGGRKTGNGWIAYCPAHDDRNPSLSLRETSDGKILLNCFAGCNRREIIDALRARGLWRGRDQRRAGDPRPSQHGTRASERECARRKESAIRLWRSAVPAAGTLGEAYLRHRGIEILVPSALRFHASLKHPSGSKWPSLVAAVAIGEFDGEVVAVHRTFLARDGAAKAPLEPQKMTLGPCRGGAVRLAQAGKQLMVGEGLETCLAAMQATGLPTWAALSTSGLRALELPPEVRDVIVLADGDDVGEAAAKRAALRWLREGRRVRVARPGAGLDFNDLLLGCRAPGQEPAA